MGNSSSIADPTAADGRYISKQSAKVTRPKCSEMAAMMDTQMPLRDDLNLMGLQELDSHLSIFESSNGGRDSSTPGAMSKILSPQMSNNVKPLSLNHPVKIFHTRVLSGQRFPVLGLRIQSSTVPTRMYPLLPILQFEFYPSIIKFRDQLRVKLLTSLL
jgi:hypothetical protein